MFQKKISPFLKKIKFNTNSNKILQNISADLIATYFRRQIEKKRKQKNYWFKYGLKLGVKKFLKLIILNSKKNNKYTDLFGIRVIFFGR
jgi:hypothetical protein